VPGRADEDEKENVLAAGSEDDAGADDAEEDDVAVPEAAAPGCDEEGSDPKGAPKTKPAPEVEVARAEAGRISPASRARAAGLVPY
jgi:hypothetical protein